MGKVTHICLVLLVTIVQVQQAFGRSKIDEILSPENDFVKIVEHIGFPLSELRDPLRAADIFSHLSVYLERIKNNLIVIPSGILDRILSNKCTQDAYHVIQSLLSGNMWALKMLDAYGKPSGGLLEGNVRWLGSYDECMEIYAPPQPNTTVGDFHGQYCTVAFSFNVSAQVVPITLGICVPESCTKTNVGHDVKELLRFYSDLLPFLPQWNTPINVSETICQPVSKEWTTEATAMLYVLFFLVALVAVGSSITALEYFIKGPSEMQLQLGFDKHKETRDEKMPQQASTSATFYPPHPTEIRSGRKKAVLLRNVKSFFRCFCCFTNGEKLLSVGNTNQFASLHGIRFFSFCWVLLAHSLAVVFSTVGNILPALTSLGNWPYQVVLNGFFSVDSFFFLSGFLLGHHFFKLYSKYDGKMSWAYFYIHRYIRITPPYMLVVGCYAVFYYYMVNGPFGDAEEIVPLCRDYWWRNLLYINNFFDYSCLGMSWYLAVDMQFYIISPLFLITFWRWPKFGYLLSAVFVAITFITNFAISYDNHLFSGFGNAFPLTQSRESLESKYYEYSVKIYDKPYTRISPYVIGIALAYYLFEMNQQKKKQMKPFVLGIGWFLSSSVALIGIFFFYQRKDELIVNSVYNAVNHITYSFSLAWVVFVCCSQERSIVKSILSCKVYIPLSRLTYSAYLIHILLVYTYLNGQHLPLHYSHSTLVITYFGLLVEIYACAFLVHLILEAPFVRLEEFVMSKLRPPPSSSR